MYGLVLAAVGFMAFLGHMVLWPVIQYFLDPKGLRKYPKMAPLSGFSYIPFMMESAKGYRCGRLAELHKKHPILRTGPDTLSFSDTRAIKVDRAILCPGNEIKIEALTIGRIFMDMALIASRVIYTTPRRARIVMLRMWWTKRTISAKERSCQVLMLSKTWRIGSSRCLTK
jgi:hypothetical protein